MIAGWTASTHRLGRGRFDADNVAWTEGGARLRLPAGRPDGAEVSSGECFAAGTFAVRMRAADAPGSLSAFFLYEGVPGEANDEVDVEVMNDGSGRVLLSTWADGVQTNAAEHVLPFDPRAGFHDYAIILAPGEVRFLVDGTELRRWTEGVPTRPMQLRASAWWPAWLQGDPPEDARWAEITAISMEPDPR